MKYLFLDDERIPTDVTWINIGTGKSYHESTGAPWEVVRSYNRAISWVKNNGFPDVISFDHDLGYLDSYTNDLGIVIVTNSAESKSGLDFAKWLIEYDLDTDSMPDNFVFTVHSMNPVGCLAIKHLLDNYIKIKNERKS
jgi:hypothetical protein